MPKCFAPWVDKNTKILIIGSMPSVISIKENMYYGNPKNRFWKYMQQILTPTENTELKKEERKNWILAHKIGLWDALKDGERKGSLDSNIKNEQYNDFSKFKNIKYFLFNGKKAFEAFSKGNKDLLNKINYQVMPSTSPANASIKEEIKFAMWQEAINKILK